VADYEDTLAQIRDRDRQDEERAIAPLRPAPDALVFDTTEHSLDEVVDRLATLVTAQAP
jgi:cytidylate kinase